VVAQRRDAGASGAIFGLVGALIAYRTTGRVFPSRFAVTASLPAWSCSSATTRHGAIFGRTDNAARNSADSSPV